MNGKTSLAPNEVPHQLYRLFTSMDPDAVNFRYMIRYYNSHFSFTSFGAKIDKNLASMRDGVYTFRAHGQIYHFIDQLIHRDAPKYLQLHFYDTEAELDRRMVRTPELDRSTVQALMDVLVDVNPYAQNFKMLGGVSTLDNYRITLNASQVGAIWIEGNEEQSSYKRSIKVYDINNNARKVQCHYGCYDPLAYPLLFPHGEVGWQNKIPRVGESLEAILAEDLHEDKDDEESSKKRKNVSAREYYAYMLQVRLKERNLVLLGGRLFQQFLVDTYIKIDTCRLDFLRKNQKKNKGRPVPRDCRQHTRKQWRIQSLGQARAQ